MPKDSNTILSINSKAYPIFEIYDENLSIVMPELTHVHDYNFNGAFPYRVNIPSSGYYYVKVSNNILGGDYLFTIGSPNYSVGSYNHVANKGLVLTPTISSVEGTYDLRNVSAIPNGAIAYNLSIEGTKINRVSSEYRSFKLDSDYSWSRTAPYSWNAKIDVNNNKTLKNIWKVKLDGRVFDESKPFSLTPELRFNYVYPILPN